MGVRIKLIVELLLLWLLQSVLAQPATDGIIVASSVAISPILNLYATVVDSSAKFTFSLENATTCKQAFMSGQLDFMVTEAPLERSMHTASECNQAYDVFEIPLMHDGLVLVYHFNGSDASDVPPLVLDGDTLAGIYAGNITRWNDTELQALNSGILLPDDEIIPYYIADSDLSVVFDRALSSLSANWQSIETVGWAAGVQPVSSADGQGYLAISSTVSSASGIGFIPYSELRKIQNRVANFSRAGNIIPVSDASILAAVSAGLSTILQDMKAVQTDNYPTNIPNDMWDVSNSSLTSWPFAYITLLTIRLHSVPTLQKAERLDTLVKWLVGSSIAGTQFRNQDLIPLLAALVSPASTLVDTMTVCQDIDVTSKSNIVGGGSTVVASTITALAGLFGSSPESQATVQYNLPAAIDPDSALQQVIAGDLDFALSFTQPFQADNSVHSIPFLGLALALIANIPAGVTQPMQISVESVQVIFTGGVLNMHDIDPAMPSCFVQPIYLIQPDLAALLSVSMAALGQSSDFAHFVNSTENETVVAVAQTQCSIGIVSAAVASTVFSPVSVVACNGVLPSMQAITQTFATGTVASPNITGVYPFAAYLFVTFKVTGNCNSASSVANFTYWVATDASATTAATSAMLVTPPFISDVGASLHAITCNGNPLVTLFTSIQGEGSAFGGPIYMMLTNAYLASDSTVRISYAPTDSGTGIDDLIANKVLFAATDYRPSSSQSSKVKDLGLYATFAGAMVLAYRIDSIPFGSRLNLSREVIADIYLGLITTWNDDEIQKLNPQVQLPAAPIALVYDSDPSGMSSVFSSALSSFSSSWTVSPSASISWPVQGVAVAGPDNVAAQIASTNFALGFLGLLEASNLPYATIRNKAGNWVSPGLANIQSAINDSINNFNDDLYCSLVDGAGATSWPLTLYTYTAIHQTSMQDMAQARKLLDFIIWATNSSEALIESYGYAGIPQSVFEDKLLPQLHRVKVHGKHVLPGPSRRALKLGLGIGLGLGGALVIAAVILFLLWRRRREAKKRNIDPRSILSEVWDDINQFKSQLESSIDSPIVVTPLLSPPSSSITRLLKGSGSDQQQQQQADYEANTDVAIGNGHQLFTFDLPAGSRFPVEKELVEEIELTNNSNSTVGFKIFVPYSEYQFRMQITPGHGTIKKGETLVVEARFTLLMTTDLTRKVKFEFSGQSKQTTISIIPFSLRGEVSTRLDPDDIDIIGKPIGKGAFGTVYKGSYRGSAVAIKVLRRQNDLSSDQLADFLKEIELMSKLRSPYVVNLLGASYIPGKMCVLTEFMDKGSVSRLLKAGHLKDLMRLKIAKDTARAMAFLHNNGVMHRDLKPANLLIVSLSKSAEISVKVSDFGTSRSVHHIFQPEKYTKGLGTPKYMAPEIFTGSMYSGKVDVYAFAILLLELFTQKDPFNALTKAWDIPEFVTTGQRPNIPESVPGEVSQVIRACWQHNPDDRPDFNQLIETLEPLHAIELEKAMAMKAAKIPDGSALPAELDSEKDFKESYSNSLTGHSASKDGTGDHRALRSDSNSTSNSARRMNLLLASSSSSPSATNTPNNTNTITSNYGVGTSSDPTLSSSATMHSSISSSSITTATAPTTPTYDDIPTISILPTIPEHDISPPALVVTIPGTPRGSTSITPPSSGIPNTLVLPNTLSTSTSTATSTSTSTSTPLRTSQQFQQQLPRSRPSSINYGNNPNPDVPTTLPTPTTTPTALNAPTTPTLLPKDVMGGSGGVKDSGSGGVKEPGSGGVKEPGVLLNFKDEPRIGWTELQKQFEEGTDGIDMTNSMLSK